MLINLHPFARRGGERRAPPTSRRAIPVRPLRLAPFEHAPIKHPFRGAALALLAAAALAWIYVDLTAGPATEASDDDATVASLASGPPDGPPKFGATLAPDAGLPEPFDTGATLSPLTPATATKNLFAPPFETSEAAFAEPAAYVQPAPSPPDQVDGLPVPATWGNAPLTPPDPTPYAPDAEGADILAPPPQPADPAAAPSPAPPEPRTEIAPVQTIRDFARSLQWQTLSVSAAAEDGQLDPQPAPHKGARRNLWLPKSLRPL